jgi:hypothetical protein
MAALIATVLGGVTGLMLSLAYLVGHRAIFAGVLAILMGGFTAVMLRFAATVPIALAFLVFYLTLPMLPVPEMLLVVVRGRTLCDSLHGGPQAEHQEHRDDCEHNLSHLDSPFHLTAGFAGASVTFALVGG